MRCLTNNTANSSIKLRGLTTGYASRQGNVVVTPDINASLSAGSLTCLLGPNGAGKSTLLKTLASMLPPVGGSFQLLGKEISDYTPVELSRTIGIVLTVHLSAENMTVRELVALGRSPYTGFFGRLSALDDGIVNQAMEMTGISHLSDRSAATLSDGERQKALIAKALSQQTSIILLDEPTAFLDFPSKVEIMLLLRDLCRKKGLTVFMSTHDIDLALQIADSVWLLDHHHGLTEGCPEDLALTGVLSCYFSGNGIAFDALTGLFEVRIPADRRLTVSGSGPEYEMMCKALRRIGISPASGPEPEIIASPDGFHFHGHHYSSIAALLQAITS